MGPRLLVVSEESALVGIVQRHADGNAAISAVRYADVRQACADETPDAMLFDVPGHLAQGYEALKLLQAVRKDLPAMPVLVLAWQRLPQRLAEGVLMLEKPFAVAALREGIETLLRSER